MVHAGMNVLHQRTASPDIQGLQTIADTKDRLVQVVGILQEQLVGCIARLVGESSFRGFFRTIFLGINVRFAAWQQYGGARRNQTRNLFWGTLKRNDYRLA